MSFTSLAATTTFEVPLMAKIGYFILYVRISLNIVTIGNMSTYYYAGKIIARNVRDLILL